MTNSPLTVGVGWLRGTFRGDAQTAYDTLRPFFGDPTPRSGGTRFYAASSTVGDGRVLVAWDGTGGAAGTVMVDVTQTALDQLGWTRGLELLAALADIGLRPSRLDLFLDDRDRHADARMVRAAIVQGDYVSHAQPGGYREDDRTGGATAYLGSRESDRMLRAYDKDRNGDDPRTRYELETKGEAARSSLGLLLSAVAAAKDPRTAVTEILLGFVDFRDRAEVDRGDRAPRLDWWASICDGLRGVRGVVAQRADSLARRARWIVRQVAPTLAAVWARPEYGNNWLDDILSDGLDRAGGYQWARAS